MARPTVGPVSARAAAKQRMAQFTADRAQRGKRIEEHVKAFYVTSETIAALRDQISAHERDLAAAVGGLAAESVSLEDTAALLDLDLPSVRRCAKPTQGQHRHRREQHARRRITTAPTDGDDA